MSASAAALAMYGAVRHVGLGVHVVEDGAVDADRGVGARIVARSADR